MTEPILGMIQYYAFDWAPKYYALANGALLSIAQNTALFSLLGTTYGGNGQTTFALPNLCGRAVVGQGNNYSMGEVFGTTTVTMLTSNMPMHTHGVGNVQIPAYVDPRDGSTATDPSGAYAGNVTSGALYSATAVANSYLGAPSVTVGVAGGSMPFNIQNPYIALTATIATAGIYPSRN